MLIKYKNKLFLILIISIACLLGVCIGNRNFFLVGLIFSPLAIWVIAKNKLLVIVLVVLLNEKLIGINIGIDNMHIILLALITLCFIITIFELLVNKFKKTRYYNCKIIMFILGVVIVEVFNANYLNNQPLSEGFLAIQRYFKYLFYFYIISYIDSNKKRDKLINTLIYLSAGISIIFIVQAFLYPNIIFLNLNYGMRNGMTRFYNSMPMIIFIMFLTIQQYLKTRNKKYLYIVSLQLIELILVAQTRNVIIALIGTVLILLIFTKNNTLTKTKVIILGAILCIIILSNKDGIVYNMIFSAFSDVSNREGSAGFRVKELEYYLKGFYEKFLLGNGIYYDAPGKIGYYMLGRNYAFYQCDVGVLGFLFEFGILGIMPFFILLINNFRRYTKIKSTNNISLKLSIIFIVISLPFEFYLQSSESIIYIVLLLALNEYKEKIKLE